jgi:hypothetical protein
MSDEGGGVAVFGRDFDLLVDHGVSARLLPVSCFFLSIRLQGNRNMTRRGAR